MIKLKISSGRHLDANLINSNCQVASLIFFNDDVYITRMQIEKKYITLFPGQAQISHFSAGLHEKLVDKPALSNVLPRHCERLVNRLGCQQAFSKPCLENLISKDTNQVFSKYGAMYEISVISHMC